MEAAFAELPLAVFTTLAPIGAAGFIAFALASFSAEYADGQAQCVDKMSLAPFAVALVGFAASMLHLANPLAAMGAIAGIGRSPLTNEIIVGGVFMVAAAVYVALAFTGKLAGVRKPLSAVIAVLAVVFCAFVGFAYMIPTVSSWNSVMLPVEIVGYALVGGCAFGALAMVGGGVGAEDAAGADGCVAAGVEPKAGTDAETAAGAAAKADAEAVGKALRIAAVAGAVLAIVAEAAQLAALGNTATAVASGSALVAAVAPFAVIGLVLVSVAAAELVRGFAKGMTRAIAVRALVEVAVGAFLIRLSFYAMYMSVGVTLL